MADNPSKMEEGGGAPDDDSIADYAEYRDEYVLTDIEKRFLLAVERGDCATVRRMIHSNKDNPDFNLNCVDPLNRSALISAIENENFDLMTLLLDEGIEVKDALLHAISEEYVEAVEELLHWEETHHVEGTPYSWEAMDRGKSTFTPDISPLILAAHRNNYEILKVLLDRGASIPMPHDVKCGCDECVTSQETDSLRHSQSRINAYRALSASSLIALSSRDPVLTAFELAWELKRLQTMESEFRAEYHEMRLEVQEFSTSLLDHARTSNELEIMLNFDHEATTEIWMPGERQTLERLKLAIKYKQKNFVAHPNVQQLLAAIWYEGLPGFRRKTMAQQLKDVAKLGCMFPVYSMNYIFKPDSDMAKFMRKPFVKFISHSASYLFFLTLLGAASQRVEVLALEFIGLPWMLEILEDWKKHERGSIPGPIELGIIMYIMSLIFGELKTLYEEGIFEYISDLWNIIDFISNMFYCTWILCRVASFIIVQRDYRFRGLNPWFPREQWHPFDPMLLSEGAFAAGMIFSFLKLVHIFSINPHLGPLQVSLGRMIIDIIKFFFIYTLVLFAFGCGLNQLLWYYADLEKHKCYHLHPDVPDFDEQEKACTIWRRFANLFETSQSLFWASFGLVDLVSFDLAGIKSFTRFWALLMFGSYSVINIIVLLNMLIAMMSNSYQIIAEKADVEWKFARSQLWISYFDDGDTVPPPFNMCPSVKMFRSLIGKGEQKRTKSIIRKSLEKAVLMHDKVMRLLVRRYITAEQRKRDEFSITEDDIMEVRQDISSLRFELIEIFNQNNMKVPRVDNKNNAATKKGRVMERRILKDFQIGIVEGLQTENPETKDVFSTIAKIIQRKQSQRGTTRRSTTKRDWNKSIRSKGPADPIGSGKASEMRRSQRSLRRHSESAHNINSAKLIDLNPKLEGVTPTTRVAYVKFMTKKLERQDQMKLIREVANDSKGTPDITKSALTLSMKKRLESQAGSSDAGAADQKGKDSDSKGGEKEPSAKPAPEKSSAPEATDKKDTEASKKTDSEKQDSKSVATAKTPAPHPPAAKPGDSKTGETKPTDSKTDQAKPGEAKPGETKPASGAPTDSVKSKAPAPPSGAGNPGAAGETKAAGGDSKAAGSDAKAAGGDAKAAASDAKAAGGDAKAAGGDAKAASGDAKAAGGDSKPAGGDAKAAGDDAKAAGGDSKPAGGDAKAAGGDAKDADGDKKDAKPTDKTLKPPAPQTKPGQSNVGIGSDKGKSTVTGRVISGWL